MVDGGAGLGDEGVGGLEEDLGRHRFQLTPLRLYPRHHMIPPPTIPPLRLHSRLNTTLIHSISRCQRIFLFPLFRWRRRLRHVLILMLRILRIVVLVVTVGGERVTLLVLGLLLHGDGVLLVFLEG